MLVSLASAQTSADLLNGIREKMAQNLSQMPNYTCTQLIERSERRSAKQKLQAIDKIRLEVAVVGNKELLAWPGASKFEDKSMSEFVGGGTTATGDYAIHAQTIFRTLKPTFTFGGEETFNGRRAVRFDYDVTLAKSEFFIQNTNISGKAPYHGSFWADRDTLDLLRLNVIVDAAPPALDVARSSSEILYGKAKVGQSDFLLPRQVDLSLRRLDGSEQRNQTTFTGCRQYVGDSVLVLDFSDSAEVDSTASQQALELPPGLELMVQLNAAVSFKTAVVGDTFNAKLMEALKRDKKILVPKGATLNGRIRAMLQRGDYVLVGLEIFEVEFEGKKATLLSRLREAGPVPGAAVRSLVMIPSDVAGVGTFLVQTARIDALPKNFRMTWTTLPKSK